MKVAFGMTVSANLIKLSLYVAEQRTFWHEFERCLGEGGGGGRGGGERGWGHAIKT